MTDKISILTPPYIAKAYHLIENEGWTVSEQDLRTLLAYPGTQAYMIIGREKVIGMIVAIAYDKFGFLGNLIVDPSYRHQGLGTQLLHHAIARLSKNKIQTIMLDAVPQAVPLYQRIGFKPICKSLRFRGNFTYEEIKLSTLTMPMRTQINFTDVLRLDQEIFGADRSGLLKTQFQRYPQFCHTSYMDGKITGYIMATPYKDLLKIGPWISTQNSPAPEILLQNLLSLAPTAEIYLGVLEMSKRGVELMQRFNIPLHFHSIRMIYGGDNLPHSSGMLAIGGPDRG